jgi:hypothetical protein
MSSELGVLGSRVMCHFMCHFSVIRDSVGSMTSGRQCRQAVARLHPALAEGAPRTGLRLSCPQRNPKVYTPLQLTPLYSLGDILYIAPAVTTTSTCRIAEAVDAPQHTKGRHERSF